MCKGRGVLPGDTVGAVLGPSGAERRGPLATFLVGKCLAGCVSGASNTSRWVSLVVRDTGQECPQFGLQVLVRPL